jgi:hypothetical protein
MKPSKINDYSYFYIHLTAWHHFVQTDFRQGEKSCFAYMDA